MKKIKVLFLVFVLTIILFPLNTVSATESLDIYFFWGNGCPHCAKERSYLDTLKDKYQFINIHDFEIYNHGDNVSLLQNISKKLDVRVDGVPFLIIGDKQFVGFSEYSTPSELENRIEYCLGNQCSDSVAEIVGINNDSESVNQAEDIVVSPGLEGIVIKDLNIDVDQGADKNQDGNGYVVAGEDTKVAQETDEVGTEVSLGAMAVADDQDNEKGKEIVLPIIGKINSTSFSLPILTIIMGALDGFNPCAMWTLLFLISLLLGIQDKKRMWILGIAFIVASSSVYFLFMVAWLNLILFLGFIIWVRLVIGLVALLGGSYNLKEFFTNKDSGCKVTNNKKRQRIFNKIKSITQVHSFWLALGGIIILAFAVNLVELICSAGLPAVYTQILALSDLTNWQYYLYISLYIFVFMIDDLFIFFTAMITLQMTGITTKYTRISKLIGGLLMLIIGLLLVFKPELLMLG